MVTARLRAIANPANAAGMARFGIRGKRVLGSSIPSLRSLAKEIGRDHHLAMQLWRTGIHGARILAAFVDDPSQVTEQRMEEWMAGFDSWDVCDQVCGSLFDRTPFAWDKAVEWAGRDEEFVKRAGFALIAYLRQIGKRNAPLHAMALAEARRIAKIDSRAARWIASDAIRDLQHEDHLRRLGIKAGVSGPGSARSTRRASGARVMAR